MNAVRVPLTHLFRPRIFSIGTKFEKHGPFYDGPVTPGAFTADPHSRTALPRRNMFASSFSRGSVRRSEDRIVNSLNKFLTKLQTDYEPTKQPLDLSLAIPCFMADTILDFTFAKHHGNLDAPGFESEIIVSLENVVKMTQWAFYFLNLAHGFFRFTEMLPNWVREKYFRAIVTQQWGVQVGLATLDLCFPTLQQNYSTENYINQQTCV